MLRSAKFAKAFGKAVRDARIYRKMTQQDLADKTRFHVTAISHIETGRREPMLRNAVLISQALGFSLSFLLDRVLVNTPITSSHSEQVR